MRIQNNIMAMNTHRMYTVNNSNIQKSAEKLSSGYRINRAGDDAAGLAISEKMRSQIRGLGMASKNSQDAISLVQTAEGALQEVHSMLQRMNELAVQSATGTNQTFDRLQLAKEFDQLKREINDISDQTTFNNMKILDGSLSSQGPVRSNYTAGIVATVADIDEAAKGVGVASAVKGQAAVTAEEGVYSAQLSTTEIPNGATTGATDVTLTVGGQSITASATLTGTDDHLVVSAAFDGKTITVDNITYDIADNAGKLTFTARTASDTKLTGDISFSIDGLATQAKALTEDTEPKAPKEAINASVSLNINPASIKAGDTLNIDGTTFTFTEDATDLDTNMLKVPSSVDELLTDLQAAAAGGKFTNVNVNAATFEKSGSAIKITSDAAVEGEEIMASYEAKAGNDKETFIEMDSTKLRVGDVISVAVDNVNYEYTWQEGDTLENVANGLSDGTNLLKDVADTTFKTNTLRVAGIADVTGFQPVVPAEDSYGTMRIQVGALENEQLNIEVKSMNTAGLKLDGFNLETQDSAGAAITATRSAIDLVSDQRSLLGAMQNRLEHKISNLDNTAENLQAAESRIRDVDIAKEMTNFTKNNILAQAATAMLAQANAAPQSVLSLLQ